MFHRYANEESGEGWCTKIPETIKPDQVIEYRKHVYAEVFYIKKCFNTQCDLKVPLQMMIQDTEKINKFIFH